MADVHASTLNTLKNDMEITKNTQSFVCSFCGENFGFANLLEEHLKSSHPNVIKYYSLICPTCEKTFTSKKGFDNHLRLGRCGIGNGENPVDVSLRPYVCRFCGKGFTQKGTLTTHERIHTQEKPYVCSFCNKGFHDKGSLRKHERIHTGVKPFVCKFCNKSFSQNCSLKIHERTHTGEKPFQCKICDRKFADGSSLRKHEKTHLDKIGPRPRPHVCTVCDKAFLKKQSLTAHQLRVHTGEKPSGSLTTEEKPS